jgi:dolichol-phosphate mannosyltransferase
VSPELSVVVPVYRCGRSLPELHERLRTSLASIPGGYEIVLVEDGGDDDSWGVASGLAGSDPAVRAVKLSRNFGQHAAITAGIARSRGRWVAVIDCDLQDPPEALPLLYAHAQQGYDIVYGKRRRSKRAWPRTLLSKVYFGLLGFLTGARFDSDYGTLSVISRKVADAFLRVGDHNRQYLLILRWLGFSQAALEYDHAIRVVGQSSYTLRSLLRHAFQGIFFQTTVLLRWVVYSGFLVAAAGAGTAVYFAVARLAGTAYPGWTSLIVLMLLLSGVIIVSVGVVGLYLGEVFDQVRGRPLFLIDAEVGSADAEDLGYDATTS